MFLYCFTISSCNWSCIASHRLSYYKAVELQTKVAVHQLVKLVETVEAAQPVQVEGLVGL